MTLWRNYLFKEVALYLMDKHREVIYFLAVKKLAPPAELNTLIEKYMRDGRFYLQLLYAEGRYREGLRYIDQMISLYRLSEFIRPYMPRGPSEGFRIISNVFPPP
jgi:hypothetical protein